jgi:hypothetical protein
MTNETQSSPAAFLREDYFNEAEAARALDRAPITLAIWRMKRIGPPVTRIGRQVLYKKASLKAWVAAQEGPPSTTFGHATA